MLDFSNGLYVFLFSRKCVIFLFVVTSQRKIYRQKQSNIQQKKSNINKKSNIQEKSNIQAGSIVFDTYICL